MATPTEPLSTLPMTALVDTTSQTPASAGLSLALRNPVGIAESSSADHTSMHTPTPMTTYPQTSAQSAFQLALTEFAPTATHAPFVLTPTHERRVLRRHSRSAPHPYVPRPYDTGPIPRRTPSATRMVGFASTSSTCIIPAINQDGSYKCCANCMTAETPSWRRHPDTQQLLCNACGLYLRLHRKARPITVDDAGHIQVIRKNAAVHRDPINVARDVYSPQPTMLQPPGYAMRASTSLASLPDVGEYPMDLGFVPSYTNGQYPSGPYSSGQYANSSYSHVQLSTPYPSSFPQVSSVGTPGSPPRLIDDMLQLQIAASQTDLPVSSALYANNGWIPDNASPSPTNLFDALAVKDESSSSQ
ncbi:hypothetical protein IW148_005872 [Coemansia sp. RSA 1199]|nr:hypothetical protein IW148_005872 [Coemansia sp. RSA 1199]